MSAGETGAAKLEAVLNDPKRSSWEEFLSAIEESDFLLPFNEVGELAMVGPKDTAWIMAFTSEERVKEAIKGDPVVFLLREKKFRPTKLLPWLPGPSVPGEIAIQVAINPGTKPNIILQPEVIAQLRDRAPPRRSGMTVQAKGGQEARSAAWEDLHGAFRSRFGETEPSGTVIPLRGPMSLALPGLCITQFAPSAGRASWLHSSLGLSQPRQDGKPGLGIELVIETRKAEQWPPAILGWAIHGMLSGEPVAAGNAIEAVVAERADGSYVLTGPDPKSNKKAGLKPLGSSGGFMVFPCLPAQGPLETRSGPVALLSLVFAPADDLRLARETTAAHVALLARELGVGQVSDLSRPALVSNRDAKARWKRIAALGLPETLNELGIQGDHPYRPRR